MMNGKTILFPTPYPDETLYSVICRYDLLTGRNSFRGTSEELFGRRNNLNAEIPQCIGSLVKSIPARTGLSAEYFIQNTTMFPYFKPFISRKRDAVFREYMTSEVGSGESKYFSLGIGKLRYPKNTHLKFCEECWQEDVKKYGEPYWHRRHQLPGALVCSTHKRVLMNSPIFTGQAVNGLFIADERMILNSVKCAELSAELTDKFADFSKNCDWILKEAHRLENYDTVSQKYDLWIRHKGFRSYSGKTWHKELYKAIVEYYGVEFLKKISAYEEIYPAWLSRIMFYPDGMQHPMFHILLTSFLAGNTQNFFDGDCPETLPYGKGPWPCRNKLCEFHLKDVIESIKIKYDKSACRTVFKCPHCGFAYRRKQPIPKEKQYTGTVYVADYGWLWEKKLVEYLVEQKLTPRQTCRLLGCDFYTVDRHAVELGLWAEGELTTYKKAHKKIERISLEKNEMQKKDYRKRWRDLIKENPEAGRNILFNIDSKTSLWLQKNDRKWYDKNSPPATYISTNWKEKDRECLKKVKEAVRVLKSETGKPKLMSLKRIARITGLHTIIRKDAEQNIPLTMSYLSEHLETEDEWRKRKIRWAVEELSKSRQEISVGKILIKCSVSREYFEPLKGYAQKCIDERLNEEIKY
ncbi:MAG: TniQ family protein [Clostridia bacterium]|nr:TniQ family protein [Clostridia bacterium]